jgi:hypothetical protein
VRDLCRTCGARALGDDGILSDALLCIKAEDLSTLNVLDFVNRGKQMLAQFSSPTEIPLARQPYTYSVGTSVRLLFLAFCGETERASGRKFERINERVFLFVGYDFLFHLPWARRRMGLFIPACAHLCK